MSDLRKRAPANLNSSPTVAAGAGAAAAKESNSGADKHSKQRQHHKPSLFNRIITYIRYTFTIVLAFFLLLLILLIYQNGGTGGELFPAFLSMPIFSSSSLQIVATLPSPPGNIAVSSLGRIIFSFHPEYNYPIKVAELIRFTGESENYTEPLFETFRAFPSISEQALFSSILSVRIHEDIVYLLDFGHFGIFQPTLFSFSLLNDTLIYEYKFPSTVAGIGSMVNDMVISPDGQWIYIAEMSQFAKQPGIIVYHVPTHSCRKVLTAHHSTLSQHYISYVDDQPIVAFGIYPIRPNIDSITLDSKGVYLYYAPVTHRNLFRIRTNYLHDNRLTDIDLDSHVEVYANKTISDGITIDHSDNIYLTDYEHSAIQILTPYGDMATLVMNRELLQWPDGLSFGPSPASPHGTPNYLYITSSALQIKFGGNGDVQKNGPYHITRLKLGVIGTAGQ